MNQPSCSVGTEQCDQPATWEAELWLDGPSALFYNACETHLSEIIDTALEQPSVTSLNLNRLSPDYLAFHQSHQGATDA